MKNVIVDLGNYNVKYYSDRKGKFSSKYRIDFNANGDMYDRVEVYGEVTYIATGTLEREFNKVNKNYLPQLLYAIDCATDDTDINLCLLLPVVQMPNRNVFIGKLKDKLISHKVNGRDKIVKINEVVVLPEGYVSYFMLDVTQRSGEVIVIDIGSRTINYSWFSDNKIQDSFTDRLGVFDLYTKIKDYENSRGEDYTEEDIERLIKNNKIVVDTKFYKDFFKEVLNKTKGKVNLKTFDVYFVGGGAMLLRRFIELNTPGIVIEDADFANVVGAYNVCKSIWG